MDSKKILKFVIDTGDIMLKNGADTTRVEDTMSRILSLFPFEENQVFVTTTGIFGSIIDTDGNILSMVRRIKERAINLEKISLVNSLSRELSEGKINIEQAVVRLELINEKPSYKDEYKYFACGLSCCAFTFILGGSPGDSLTAFITGFCLYFLLVKFSKKNISAPMQTIIGGAFAGFFCLMLLRLGLGDNMDKTIIGSIIPLLPGMAFTNAVRDIFAGEYLSGICRGVDAALMAICIATGVGIGVGFWFYAEGGLLWL